MLGKKASKLKIHLVFKISQASSPPGLWLGNVVVVRLEWFGWEGGALG